MFLFSFNYPPLYHLPKCRTVFRELTADPNPLAFCWMDSNSQTVCMFRVQYNDSTGKCGKIDVMDGLTLENYELFILCIFMF
jgi:hypothetical protein